MNTELSLHRLEEKRKKIFLKKPKFERLATLYSNSDIKWDKRFVLRVLMATNNSEGKVGGWTR
jgi:hypothetical protein